jgi:hypothetical protein
MYGSAMPDKVLIASYTESLIPLDLLKEHYV